ncbi:hypothetical protein DFH06DRAFT_1139940 [Mycena polygramma]|nr:hypothetical protein DFH06DRAFT_1139940 [Mycena polygramma]
MFPTTTITTTTTTNSRRHPQRRFSVDLLLDALPTALAPKRPRCVSLPTPHRPTAVPRKSALKRPRALSEGDVDICHIQLATVSADDAKQALSGEHTRPFFSCLSIDFLKDEVKLAFSLERRLARDSTLDNVLDTMSAHVPRTVRKLFQRRSPSRAYWKSHDEYRATAVRRNSNLPPPVEWDEVAVIFQSEVVLPWFGSEPMVNANWTWTEPKSGSVAVAFAEPNRRSDSWFRKFWDLLNRVERVRTRLNRWSGGQIICIFSIKNQFNQGVPITQ